jgi:hypothetical protein
MSVFMARGALAACLLLLVQSPSIRYDNGKNLFILENWAGAAQVNPTRASDVFTVSVDAPNVPAMIGRYRVENGTLIFAPQFPPQPGITYKATAKIPGSAPLSAVFSIPKADLTPKTVVERVYPSVNVLPENQLKFYIYFSSPMARGFAYEHVTLVDDAGKRVEVPFLQLGEELWDPTGKRFTLFFDPGRIKRGLLSHQELGIALHEGKRYTLVIDKGWKDSQGRLMFADFRKTFTVGPPDRKTVDLKAWTVRRPAANTRNPLTVVFPEPMDHAIVQRELDVVTSAGAVIKGAIAVGPDEKSWLFTPDVAWKKGSYKIRVGTALADLAGNMIDRPFEIDVFERVDQNLIRSTRSLDFQVD